ncbi:MAG: 2-amino-4-hydroxy-6-hydroxymethyldihydropteridine diphosphokinase [Candidatus Saccharimonadales bacterium]
METVYIALGSNVGDSVKNIGLAIEYLAPHLKDIQTAKLYKSKPVGYVDQPNFINTAIKAMTELSPSKLLEYTKEVEVKTGRVKRFHWGPREIDIDIIFYGNRTINLEDLIIPHPRFAERDFVLKPLLDLDNSLVDPTTNEPLSLLLENIKEENRSIIGFIENNED